MSLRSAFELNGKSRGRTRSGRIASASPASPAKTLETMGVPNSYGRNTVIFCEGEPAESIYKIESGCVRTHKTLDSGERQMVAFHLPGDCLGLEGREKHAVSAEATTVSQVRIVKRKTLMARNGDSLMVRYLLDLTAEELRRAQRHNLLLLKGAQERVVGFLHEMAEREHADGEIALHMTRRDIADYLGLTIETVSRTLSRLESESAISLPTPWRVVLRDSTVLN